MCHRSSTKGNILSQIKIPDISVISQPKAMYCLIICNNTSPAAAQTALVRQSHLTRSNSGNLSLGRGFEVMGAYGSAIIRNLAGLGSIDVDLRSHCQVNPITNYSSDLIFKSISEGKYE